MPNRIDKIVIVGGGTAGWMSAAFFEKALGKATGRNISVTVVESDDVGIIGVGEATIPAIRKILQFIGVPEERLFTDADAAFKNAIRFVNWSAIPEPGKSTHFYHPFDPPLASGGFDALTHWLALKNAGEEVPSAWDAVSIGTMLCDHHRGPKLFSSEPYQAPLNYAYHVDTVKLGRLLRGIAMERGVERIIDHVVKVNRAENGDIASLDTRDGRSIEADLFIDCTGFAAALVEKSLGEPFIDYSDWLLCDRAVAGQAPYKAGATPRPYTVSTAKTAGWIWEIDLFHRTGTGYVYSSKFLDDDAAEKEFLEHIDSSVRDQVEPRRLKMRIGRRENLWINNCVAIGLSGGFIEPLESTGIHLIELGLLHLVDYMAEGHDAEPLKRQYNKIMREVYDEIANFILIHYIFNKREGLPFWDHYRNKIKLPETLVAQLEIWNLRLPTGTDLKSRVNIFEPYSYFAILAGMNALPKNGNNISPFVNLEDSKNLLRQIAQIRQEAIDALPLQSDYLKRLRPA